ncbi:hypothetical protein Lalb_Chr02g0156561 [Lupinus albus]|uniref:Transmembrane protein n=1 Tax=Lupinus albus TaxID=3870 RepID=A0A6A4R174_LUPAL|nr:hypothetical protein Lalb_Chr02g0156561 [Lupinus albus]
MSIFWIHLKKQALMVEVFGFKSMVFMVVLSIALLVLPLVLPQLPPPPMILMFVPVLVMFFLVMLVFSHKSCPDMIYTSDTKI